LEVAAGTGWTPAKASFGGIEPKAKAAPAAPSDVLRKFLRCIILLTCIGIWKLVLRGSGRNNPAGARKTQGSQLGQKTGDAYHDRTIIPMNSSILLKDLPEANTPMVPTLEKTCNSLSIRAMAR
jgi:hypothetical protein